jgi:hypothetical protein
MKMDAQVATGPSRWVNWLVACLAVFLICSFASCAGLLWRAGTVFNENVKVFNENLSRAGVAMVREEIEQKLDQWFVVLVFLGNLNPTDIEGSYDYTSEAFRRRQSLSEFTDYIGRHPEVQSGWVKMDDEDGCTYRITTKIQGRITTFRLRLCREAGTWKVDEIMLPSKTRG